MEFTAPDTIKKYVSINVLSRDNAYFLPQKNEKKSIQCRLIAFSDDEITIETAVPLSVLDGAIHFYSYHLLMRFPVNLEKRSENNRYCCQWPSEITVDERRQFPRVRFESEENKSIRITCRKTQKVLNAVLFNLSASGLGFYLTDPSVRLEVGQTLYFDFDMLGVTINRLGRVQYQEGSLVGCQFLYVKPAFMTRVHQVIFKEIEWRSDRFLEFLYERKDMVDEFYNRLARKSQKKSIAVKYFNRLGPFLDFSISMVNSFFDIQLKQRDVRFDNMACGPYDALLFFEGRTKEFKFRYFLCSSEKVLLDVCNISHGTRASFLSREVENLLSEAGRMIVENAGNRPCSGGQPDIALSSPSLIFGECCGICSLSPLPCVRVIYDSPMGDFEVMLLIEEEIRELNDVNSEQDGELHEPRISRNLELIEPIYNSVVEVFSNFLNLHIKETRAVVRSPMMTQFEISAIQELTGSEIEGKVVLNVSENLALSIYERVFHHHPANREVETVELIGEILRKIIDKAGEGFSQLGHCVYPSVPFLIKGKKYNIRNIDNQPFLTSTYVTPAGEFQLGYTVIPRGAHNPPVTINN